MKVFRVDRFELGSAGSLTAERDDRGFRIRMIVGLAASCLLLVWTLAGSRSGWLAALVFSGFVLPHLLWLRVALGRDRIELDAEKLRIRELRPLGKTRGRTVPRTCIGGLRLRRDKRILASMKLYPPWFWRFIPVRTWVVEIVEGPARNACVELLVTRDESLARAKAQEVANALALPLEEATGEGTIGAGEIAWVWWRSGADGLFHGAVLFAVLVAIGGTLRVAQSTQTLPCEGEFRATALAVDPDASQVYWLDPAGGMIHRSELDGSGGQPLIAFAQPSFGNLALDLDERKIYWSERRSGLLSRADLDGTHVEELASGRDIVRFALDSKRRQVYWVQREDTDGQSTAWASYWRASLDGSNPEPLPWRIPDDGIRDATISSSSGHFYWTARRGGWPAVFRILLDGPATPEVVFTQKDVDSRWVPTTLALDPAGETLFWIDGGTHMIQRAAMGDSVYDEITAVSELERAYVAFDPIHDAVYWSDGCRIQHAPTHTLVARAPRD